MKFIKVETVLQMSSLASEIISAKINSKNTAVLGFATGSTPIKTYEILVDLYEQNLLDFSQVKTVNLDEYCSHTLPTKHSYRYFMDSNLFDKININKENTYLPNGKTSDIESECARYENLINSLGGIDLQILGIGNNGHIGFNEPSDRISSFVHHVNLCATTIEANARLFENPDQVPTTAITMGIGTIMRAREIVLLANKSKTDIINQALFGEVTPQLPASFLQLHPNVTVILSTQE